MKLTNYSSINVYLEAAVTASIAVVRIDLAILLVTASVLLALFDGSPEETLTAMARLFKSISKIPTSKSHRNSIVMVLK
jgi:hypothetical protein